MSSVRLGVDTHICELRDTPAARFYRCTTYYYLKRLFGHAMPTAMTTGGKKKTKIFTPAHRTILHHQVHHSRFAIEDFVETYLYKLCVILRSRVLLLCVSLVVVRIQRLATLLRTSLHRGQQGEAIQFVHGNCKKTVFSGDKI